MDNAEIKHKEKTLCGSQTQEGLCGDKKNPYTMVTVPPGTAGLA